jgi:hypothetical protein
MLDVACVIESPPLPEMRRHRRLPALRHASLRSSQSGAVSGAITDLSMTGCRITTRGPFWPGMRICVRIDGLQSWWGTVVWHQDAEIGIAFENPLHIAVVEHIARMTPR